MLGGISFQSLRTITKKATSPMREELGLGEIIKRDEIAEERKCFG